MVECLPSSALGAKNTTMQKKKSLPQGIEGETANDLIFLNVHIRKW